MTRTLLVALTLTAVCFEDGATAQETDGQGTAAADQMPATSAKDDSRSYPSASIGFKLELVSLPFTGYGSSSSGITALSYPATLEIGLDVIPRLSFFVMVGTYLQYEGATNEDYEQSQRVGAILVGGGARLNLMEPSPRHAHLYIAADMVGAIGLVSYVSDGQHDEDAEDETKEELDHLLWGVGLGLEYLLVAEFGIGAEYGFRWSYNNLEDTDTTLDELYRGQFSSFFALKLAYHF